MVNSYLLRSFESVRHTDMWKQLDPALTEVSRKVIGCAIEVHMELGPGYSESVYLNALKMELDVQQVGYKKLREEFGYDTDEAEVEEAEAT